jgi:two-component system chemotaxis response regulator CheY
MKAVRILVVDDDLWIQRTTASVLGQQGHQVSLAGDAPSAFALASRIRPDVVITTVSLPALDGWSWWERLRALPACAGIPMVFLLPPGDTASEVAGFEPRDQNLRKPFRGEDLERTIVTLLGDQSVQTATSESLPAKPQRSVDPTKPSAGHRPLSAMRGQLDQITLSSVLVVLEMERKNGILLLEHGRETGRLFLRKGRIIRAAIDEPASSGAAAVYQMVSWGQGSFDFLVGDIGGVDEIQASTTFLLMEGARRLDEAKAAGKPRALPQENKL